MPKEKKKSTVVDYDLGFSLNSSLENESRRLAHEATVEAERIAAEERETEEEEATKEEVPAVPVPQLTPGEIDSRYQEHLKRVQEGR